MLSWRDGGTAYCETLQASPNRKVLNRSDLPASIGDATDRRQRQYSELDAAGSEMVLR